MIENIEFNNKLLSVIIRSTYKKDGIEFFTPSHFSQQLGYMSHPQGHVIKPHVHNPVIRQVEYTKEVLFIKKGIVRVDFYDDHKNYMISSLLYQGDVILLAYGGHGFEILEDAEIIEVKQGPYAGDLDKTRFDPVEKSIIKFEENS